jgi:hypothetical protein
MRSGEARQSSGCAQWPSHECIEIPGVAFCCVGGAFGVWPFGAALCSCSCLRELSNAPTSVKKRSVPKVVTTKSVRPFLFQERESLAKGVIA